MSYEFYKILHILGLILLFTSLAAIIYGQTQDQQLSKSTKKYAFIGHGVGILLMLISGFGLAAKLQYFGQLPNWIYAKLVIWLVLGAAIAIGKRKFQWGSKLMLLLVGLGVFAASLAVTKPF